MRPHWIRPAAANSPQQPQDRTFAGGILFLPAAEPVPQCGACGKVQTFCFQLAFPTHHAWQGRTLALFKCCQCQAPDDPVELPPPPLYGAPISAAFLCQQQQRWSIRVFDTQDGIARPDAASTHAFARWDYDADRTQWAEIDVENPPPEFFSLISVAPEWFNFYDDRTPGLYAGEQPLLFLFQLSLISLVPSHSPGAAANQHQFFDHDVLYFFGTCPAVDPKVYMVVH